MFLSKLSQFHNELILYSYFLFLIYVITDFLFDVGNSVCLSPNLQVHRGQVKGVISPLAPYEFQRLNSGYQPWCQAFLQAETSHQLLSVTLEVTFIFRGITMIRCVRGFLKTNH